MPTTLMRQCLRGLYAEAPDAHPGLLIQRGYQEFDNQSEAGKEYKTKHIRRVCAIQASDFYHRAFQRWHTLTSDRMRFLSFECELETRLFIGLTAGGMLETGCGIAHSYGMPYIPGSSIKGVVNAFVRASAFGRERPEVCDALLGREATEAEPDGLAGAIAFHDAWWVPGSAATPFAEEVVTTHHLDYYGTEGATPATDLDSPVPNAQIAVRGRFLFVLEGPIAWLPLVREMLIAALAQAGVGAKTRSGYGFFRAAVNSDATADGDGPSRCPWVDETIARLVQQNKSKEDDTLRSKGLAEQWQAIADPDLKAHAMADIQARWQARGWWDDPPGKSARQAKYVYVGG